METFYRLQDVSDFNINLQSSHHYCTKMVRETPDLSGAAECSHCGFPRFPLSNLDDLEEDPDGELLEICGTLDGVCCCDSIEDLDRYLGQIGWSCEGMFVIAFRGVRTAFIDDGSTAIPKEVLWIKPAPEVFGL